MLLDDADAIDHRVGLHLRKGLNHRVKVLRKYAAVDPLMIPPIRENRSSLTYSHKNLKLRRQNVPNVVP